MLNTLKAYVGEYKKTAIAAPVFIIFEVIFEMIIPLLMAEIIDNGLGAGNINYVVKVGIIMLLVSFASLFCGAMAARQAAIASAGFAKNVRAGMYNHIQEFSFSNIDHFSTADYADQRHVHGIYDQCGAVRGFPGGPRFPGLCGGFSDEPRRPVFPGDV